MLMSRLRPYACRVSPAFTLVEMLVVISVLGILMAIGAPSFRSAIANQKVRTGAEGILNGLQLAQMEAIHRNTNVSFTLGSGTAWTVEVVSPASTIQSRPNGESGGNLSVSSLNNQTSVSFTPLGSVAVPDPALSLSKITVAPPAGASDVHTLRIDVLAGGQLRMCDLAVTADNDPRKC